MEERDVSALKTILTKINDAQSFERLDELEKELQGLKNNSDQALLFSVTVDPAISSRRELLEERCKRKGTHLVDAKNIFFPSNPDKDPDGAFNRICRETTPPFYEQLVEAANDALEKNQKPYFQPAGPCVEYEPGKTDPFDNPRPVTTHGGLPDSFTCLPSYGKMVEGATGRIDINIDENTRNKIRLLRALGSTNQQKAGLRQHKKNMLSLPINDYFDTYPQVALVPILPLEKIKDYKGEEVYDVAVLVMSATPAQEKNENVVGVADVYGALMNRFDWDNFSETPGEGRKGKARRGLCSEGELKTVFSVLREFIAAIAFSLYEGDPQKLTSLAHSLENKKSNNGSSRGSKSGSRNGRPPLSPRHKENGSQGGSEEASDTSKRNEWEKKRSELELAKKTIYEGNGEGLKLPMLRDYKGGPPPRVLKVPVRIDVNEDSGRCVPDPWLLMVKAAVNFSYCMYGCKLLPVCVPDPDTASGGPGIDSPPLEISIPTTISDRIAAAATQPVGASGCETTHRYEEEWDSLSATNVVSEAPAVMTPSHGKDGGESFQGD